MNSYILSGKFSRVKITGTLMIIIYTTFFYRLLKNRKSARKSRKRRKAELTTLREEIRALRQENEQLKNKLKGQHISPNPKKSANEEKAESKSIIIKALP